jgi:thiol-disulfide isomerase/thioredoxin
MLKTILAALLLAVASAASALDKQPFDAARFAALQKAGEVILIDVYAPWCPACRKQQPAIARWVEANPERKLHVLVVDFDRDKPNVTRFKAPKQSTLLLFKGDEQRWFSVGETRDEVIAAALDQAFAKPAVADP